MIYFIPARKGSQRLPGKNTAICGGRRLIEWTFDAAEDSLERWDKVVVSTDDAAVAAMARHRGFKVIDRPSALAGGDAKMNHVIAFHAKEFRMHYGVVVLYPTSPLRTAQHIREAMAVWQHAASAETTSVMSCSPVTHRPYGLMSVDEVGLLQLNSPDGAKFYQRQGMPEPLRANGAIYVLPTKAIREGLVDAQLFTPNTLPYVMDEVSGHEVDEQHDLVTATALIEWRKAMVMHDAVSNATAHLVPA